MDDIQPSKRKGFQVRKGEKGTQISFFSPVVKEIENGDEIEVKKYLCSKVYTVFNAQQIDGIEQINAKFEKPEWNPEEIGEKILRESKVDIRHGGNQAFFHPALNYIQLPDKGQFKEAGAYYSAALHELAHWSMAESRLNICKKDKFGSKDYAKEELRAEITSWLISVATGLPFDPASHTSYIGCWIKTLNEDSKEIFRACADAEKVKQYILDMAGISKEKKAA